MRYMTGGDRGEIILGFADNAVEFEVNGHMLMYTTEEFREFRRAVGYVWQEIEAANA